MYIYLFIIKNSHYSALGFLLGKMMHIYSDDGLHFTTAERTSGRPVANCISWIEKTGNC